ncbi:MAG: CRISPR-associated CARF protein Csx1 [candidate division WOR-3 bacterium]|nr:CRISPR-associated CARF protein Csx1 [candidate division WOR-3 bacterium]MCX7837401.1 CRISPR-associated CARF protein Csx1 [candidate division WOR-3 bacterium]MDW8113634.1 CRISPR-associated CARF protein Csx1 [candidate division WOR-3 bacterium]
MKILISTWGNPRNWDKVKYNYKDTQKETKDPLTLIIEKEKIDKTVIISIDTLADEEIKDELISSYKDLKNKAKEIIKNFCDQELGVSSNKIIISYGVGEFNKTRFIGNAMDYYYAIFKELAFFFKKELESPSSKEIEVFLDISHGINFLPVLTYRALREILQILAYSFEINLIVLNSDTYLRTARPSELNVNIIERTKVLPKLIGYFYEKGILEPFEVFVNHLNGYEKRELSSKDNKFPGSLYFFLSAFMHCLPVFVIYYLPQIDNLEEKINKLSEIFEEKISIDKNQNNKLDIKRKFKFNINFENLIKSFLASWILNINGFTKKKDINLKEIEKLKNKIWSKEKFPIETNSIDVEIEYIKKLNPSSEYQSYAKLLNDKEKDNIDKRNFFAHRGFEHNIIMLRKNDKNEIEISINTAFEKKINFLKNNLPKVKK